MINVVIPTKNPDTSIHDTIENLLSIELINKIYVIDQSKVFNIKFCDKKIVHVKTYLPKSAISARQYGAEMAINDKNICGIIFMDDDIVIQHDNETMINLVNDLKNQDPVSFTVRQSHSRLLIFVKYLVECTLKRGIFFDDRIVRNINLRLKKEFNIYTTSVSAGAMAIPINYCLDGVMTLVKCRGYPIQAGDLELAQEIYNKYNKKFVASDKYVAFHAPYDYRELDEKFYKARYDTKNVLN